MFKNQLIGSRRARHLARRHALPVSGRTTSSRRTTSTPARRERSAAPTTAELHRHGVRPSRPEAVVRHRRLHERRQARRSCSTATTSGCCRSTDRRRANLTNGVGTKGEIRFRYVRTEPRSAAAIRRRRRRRPGGGGRRRAQTIDLSKPITLSAYGEYTKKAGFFELANGQLQRDRLRGRVVQHADARAEGGDVPLHAPDVRRVPGSARLRARLQELEEDHRRQPAAGGVPVGPPHPVRLQEQGRPAAAGHSRAARRLQAGREAADDRELLRRRTRRTCTATARRRTSPAWARRRCRR